MNSKKLINSIQEPKNLKVLNLKNNFVYQFKQKYKQKMLYLRNNV